MPRSIYFATLVVAAIVAAPSASRAQVAWDGPMLMAPGAPAGWGFHLVDPHPGDGLGGLATWRANPAPVGLGFRVGLFEGHRDDVALVGGVDVAGTLHRGTDDAPFDVIWFLGAGMGIDDDIVASFPAGVAVGWSFSEPNLAFRPYVAPRMVLDAFFGGDGNDSSELDLGIAFEIGADLAFSSSWAIRTAASFGDRDALSIGIALPGRR